MIFILKIHLSCYKFILNDYYDYLINFHLKYLIDVLETFIYLEIDSLFEFTHRILNQLPKYHQVVCLIFVQNKKF